MTVFVQAKNIYIYIYIYIYIKPCDIQYWSNDAENSALITGINYILKCIQTENSYFKL